MRLPTYRFRPVHADPLHFDLWHRGVNLLRDGGVSTMAQPDLAGFQVLPATTPSSSTMLSQCRASVLSLGRLVSGRSSKLQSHSISAAYCSPHGRHHRQVEVDDSGLRWIVTDTCSGFTTSSFALATLHRGLATGRRFLIGPMATLQVVRSTSHPHQLGSGWGLNTTVKSHPACAGDLCWSSPSYANNFFSLISWYFQ